MNNPSPLLPQGSLLEQKNKGRARVKIAVFVVLAIHGIGLLALLMQGCKKEPEQATTPETGTNVTENVQPPAPPAADTSAPPAQATVTPQPPEQPVATVTEYTVVQGDTFSTIAKKFHVSVTGLMTANPGIEPTKLQIGQKLHIPAPAPAAATGGTSAPAADLAPGETIYTVKSGDTLTSIAAQYKVTVKAVRSANSLTTDKIKVGQKLKIPVTTPAAPASTSAPPAVPAAK